jgi:sugar phosphate isomerase/epimerase
VQLALTPDGRWGYPTAELVSAAGAAGFNAVGINADRVDRAAVESYRSAGLLCHQVLALIVGDDETATLTAARRLAHAAGAMRATWVLTVFTAAVSARTEQLIRHCAAIIANAGAAMAVEFSPLGPVSSIKAGMDAVRAASRGGRAGLMIDSWHFCFGESTWHELAAVPLDDIAYVQFSDALVPESRERLVRETSHRRALPGQGVLDLDRFAATLLDRGYNGIVSVEVLSAALRELPVDALVERLHDATAPYWLS